MPRIKMPILGIDLATVDLGIALWHLDVLAETLVAGPCEQAETLMPAIAKLCELARCTPRDLTAVGVSTGPGGFTGLRTGMAMAKGLAVALEIPVVGVPTLEAIATQSPLCGLVSPLLDARRGELYAALYRLPAEGGLPREEIAGRVTTPEAWAEMLEERGEEVLLLGEGLDVQREAIARRVGLSGRLTLARALPRRSAAAVAQLTAARLEAGDPGDPRTLSVRYLREPAAVERGAPGFGWVAPGANP